MHCTESNKTVPSFRGFAHIPAVQQIVRGKVIFRLPDRIAFIKSTPMDTELLPTPPQKNLNTGQSLETVALYQDPDDEY